MSQTIHLKPSQIYHIWTHANGNGNENLFRDEENYNFFLEKYSLHVEPVAETFAYCLMPNHLHLMVRIKEEEEVLEFVRDKKSNRNLQGFGNLGGFSKVISQQFSNLFNAYTKAINKVYDRKGSLFIPNFKRKRIDSDHYFGTLIAYIHNNPVHHGFVDHPKKWLHSSWHAYLLNRPTKIKRREGIEWFGNRSEFLRIHREINMEKILSLFEE
ncbi:MAG: hypothetical protein WEA58_01055 [Balneolaceae bacterium]